MLCAIIWLVFGILGVSLFSGRFYRCNDTSVQFRDECSGIFNATNDFTNEGTSLEWIVFAILSQNENGKVMWSHKVYYPKWLRIRTPSHVLPVFTPKSLRFRGFGYSVLVGKLTMRTFMHKRVLREHFWKSSFEFWLQDTPSLPGVLHKPRGPKNPEFLPHCVKFCCRFWSLRLSLSLCL